MSLLLALGLSACGGGGSGPAATEVAGPAGTEAPETGTSTPPDTVAPTASFVSPPLTLTKSQALVVAFSEPMDTVSLSLDGSLAAVATASWNTGADTLTLTPDLAGWPRGAGQLLGVSARDRAGNPATRVARQFLVPLDFQNNQPALAVIGQSDFNATHPSGSTPTSSDLNMPSGNPWVSPDGRLVVPDTGNHRLLVFDSIPTVNGEPASAVIGQPDFVTSTWQLDAAHRIGPRGIVGWGDRWVVSEHEAERVAIYDQSPLTEPGVEPGVVLGLANFTSLPVYSATCASSPWQLRRPTGVAVTPDGKLLVADSGHHRVLIWNQIPTVSNREPDVILGQPNIQSCVANNTGGSSGFPGTRPNASSLVVPVGLWTDGTRLVVIDAGNKRALVWNAFPTANYQPADLVLGQPDFTTNAITLPGDGAVLTVDGSSSFQGAVTSNGVQLAIADYHGNRVLLWESFPTRSFQPADRVLGKDSFTDAAATLPSQTATLSPTGLLMTSGYLLVVNGVNGNRVSVFKSN